MAAFFISARFIAFGFLIFHLQVLSAHPNSSFSFETFDKNSNFESVIALYGDANAVNNGSALQLTSSVSSSAGRVMYKKPIKLVEEESDSELIVEFDTKRDAKYGDLNDNHVGINVGGLVSVEVKNASSANVVLNDGKRLSSWIDYEASSKRLEVRLSRFGDIKPIDPLLSFLIDLPKLWKDEKIFIGLSSSNGNSSQACFIYSWSFELRIGPQWMHSEPLDPQAFAKTVKPVVIHKRSACFLRVLAAMIFGTACGALGAFIVLYLWTIFGNRRLVVPAECSVHPVDFEYKKFKVVVEKAIEDGKQ
ncbi:L-type lectin-domain containing receptor kinase S.4 isoform X2 [Hevea brasiliensis]|uniref:L-type lectin-domain containing receptor kinase S.4 isoform X2 n=1 Tax=Hevea brasiliensis TaxID=3981 RepID=UPI0025FD8946|nr:L-type lectin-domain containing receptor kinase S.4 isoform X2 [Hevea brasiliensis]